MAADIEALLQSLADAGAAWPAQRRVDAVLLLRARLQALRELSPAEVLALDRLGAGAAGPRDLALLRQAATGAPPSLAADAGARRPVPGKALRNAQTASLLRAANATATRPQARDALLEELSWRASLSRDAYFEERRKWLGQLRQGRLSEEDSLRFLSLLPRTIIELLPLLSSPARLPAPASLFNSLELLAHGAQGGWLTGNSQENCKMLIKKLLRRRVWSGERKRPRQEAPDRPQPSLEAAIDAFVDAIGPEREALREWRELAGYW